MDSNRGKNHSLRGKKNKRGPVRIGVSMQTFVSSDYSIKAINRNKKNFDEVSYFEAGVAFIRDGLYPKKIEGPGHIAEAASGPQQANNLKKEDRDRSIIEKASQLAKVFFKEHDGLIIPGNEDHIDPYFYSPDSYPLPDLNEEKNRRSLLEIALVKEAVHQGKPVLGICGGHQVIGAALGAKIDDVDKVNKLLVPESIEKGKNKRGKPGTSPVAFHPDTMLYGIIEKASEPNSKDIAKHLGEKKEDIVQFEFSFHCQAIDPLSVPYLLVISGIDNEGIIKSIEVTGHPWIIGTQYHPEMFAPSSAANEAIFKEFLTVCSGVKQQLELKKQLHNELKNAYDLSTDAKLKYNFLNTLLHEIQDPKWQNKGIKIYSFLYGVPPDGFLKLKEMLMDLKSIKNNEPKIMSLFIEVHHFLNEKAHPLTGFLQNRDIEVQAFWDDAKEKCDEMISSGQLKTILKAPKNS